MCDKQLEKYVVKLRKEAELKWHINVLRDQLKYMEENDCGDKIYRKSIKRIIQDYDKTHPEV